MRYTEGRYLDFEEEYLEKHEFYNGEIFTMAKVQVHDLADTFSTFT